MIHGKGVMYMGSDERYEGNFVKGNKHSQISEG